MDILLSSKLYHILGDSTGRVLKKKLIIDKFYRQVRSTDMYGIIRGCRWSKFSPSEI